MSPESGFPAGIDRLLSGQARPRPSKKPPVRVGGGGGPGRGPGGGKWKIPRAALAMILGAVLGTGLLVGLILGVRSFLAGRGNDAGDTPPEVLFRAEGTGIRILYDASRREVRLERGDVSGEVPSASSEDLVALLDAIGGVPLALQNPVRLKLPTGPAVLLSPEAKIYDGDEIWVYLRAGPGTIPARLRAVLLGAGRRAREVWGTPEDLEEAVVVAAKTRGSAGGEIPEAEARRAARILWALGELRPTELSVRW